MFFDGVCGLCNKSVNFLMRIDKKNRLLFAPLQGETAQNTLEHTYIKDLDSLALYIKGKTFNRSTGVLKSLQVIGGVWSVFSIFLIIPAFIRDAVYNLVAKYRYKLFGKKETCRIPTPEERSKILT